MISIIAAIGKNRELGKDNKLLWYISSDLKRFKRLTLDQVVVMGRKTFESLPDRFKPLPQRVNIVISRKKDYQEKYFKKKDSRTSLIFALSIDEALKKARAFKKKIFIIGGQSIYRQTLPFCDKLYLTLIDREFKEADVFFPEYEKEFEVIKRKKAKEGDFSFEFLELVRKK